MSSFIETVQEKLKTRITEGYFIHCKIDRPEFETLEEADNWYKQQNWIAEKVVGSLVDDTMIVLEQSLTEYKQKVAVMLEIECDKFDHGDGNPINELLEALEAL